MSDSTGSSLPPGWDPRPAGTPGPTSPQAVGDSWTSLGNPAPPPKPGQGKLVAALAVGAVVIVAIAGFIFFRAGDDGPVGEGPGTTGTEPGGDPPERDPGGEPEGDLTDILLEDVAGLTLTEVADFAPALDLGALDAFQAQYEGAGTTVGHTAAVYDTPDRAAEISAGVTEAALDDGFEFESEPGDVVDGDGNQIGEFVILSSGDAVAVYWYSQDLFFTLEGSGAAPVDVFESLPY